MRTTGSSSAVASGTTDPRSGDDIKRRRLALGIRSVNKFATALGMDWETVDKVEKGTASDQSVDAVVSWLDRQEAGADIETTPTATTAGPLRVKLSGIHGVTYDIDDVEMVFDGSTPPEVMATYVRALLAGTASPERVVEPVEEPGEE